MCKKFDFRAFILINDRYIHPKVKKEKEQRQQQLQKRRPTGASISAMSQNSDLKQRKKQKQQQRKLIKEQHKNEIEDLNIMNVYPIRDSHIRRNTHTAQTTGVKLIEKNQES